MPNNYQGTMPTAYYRCEGADFGNAAYWSVRFRGHPQEVTENAIDLAHLRHVHDYDTVKGVGPAEADAARLRFRFDFRRSQTVAGIGLFSYDATAVTHMYGLGYSMAEVREHSIGMDTRLWALPTPVDRESVELTLVSRVRRLREPRRPIAGMRFLPVGLRNRLMKGMIMATLSRDSRQDVPIGERKRYLPRPALCPSDARIGVYRRWCEQFYPV